MAEGILGGFIHNGHVSPENITVSELLPDRCEYLQKTYGVWAIADPRDAIVKGDIVIIAVNPHQIPSVTSMLKPIIDGDTLIISIAAATSIASLEEQLGSDKKIVRVMPNTLIKVQSGYSAVTYNPNNSEGDRSVVNELLEMLGQVLPIEERLFNAFSCYGNLNPLWFYKALEALIDAGVYIGFSRQDARQMMLKGMKGVACLLDEEWVHPAVKVDQLTSPAGVTIESLRVLEEEGFYKALMESVIAGFQRVNSLE